MFEMMEEKIEVVDAPDAKSLQIQKGGVTFDNVTFGYSAS